MKKILTAVLCLLMLVSFTAGCQKGKKFDSAESMISEMEGTYSGTGDHSDEYVIVGKENVVKFNMSTVFPETIDEDYFNDNFSDEDWAAFSIDVLVSKPCSGVEIEDVSADIKNSSISGFWVEESGTLYSQKKDGYAFEKVSSESEFPTEEMKKMFDEYSRKLQEFEISSIIQEAEENFSSKKESVESQLSSATNTTTVKKECTASAETIGKCAFDSIKNYATFYNPSSAQLEDWITEPQRDSYGRVATKIRCSSINKKGNYIIKDYYVILQSCTDSGQYTSEIWNWVTDDTASLMDTLFAGNKWNKDPNYDSEKDDTYLTAIELAKKGSNNYESAIKMLETLEGYRKSDSVITACKNYIQAKEYKAAIDLFADGKYSKAEEKLDSLKDVDEDGYLRTKRVIYLCQLLENGDAENNAVLSDDGSQNNIGSNTEKNNAGGNNIGSDNSSGNTSGSGNSSSNNGSSGSNNSNGNTSVNTSNGNASGGNSSSNNGSSSGSNNFNGNTSVNTSNGNAPSGGNNFNGNASGGNTSGGSTSGGSTSTHTHSYSKATCTTPATCTVCGATTGSTAEHTWEAVKSIVHHEEVGHFESVKVKDGGRWYHCPGCGVEFTSLDSYYSHFDSNHSDLPSFLREEYTHGSIPDEYEKIWVVDKKAHDEEEIVGYKCTKCGAKK